MIQGVQGLLTQLGQLEHSEEVGFMGSEVIVGYRANYALYVHENMEMKMLGKARSPKGRGMYWDPPGSGPKFLEKAYKSLSTRGRVWMIGLAEYLWNLSKPIATFAPLAMIGAATGAAAGAAISASAGTLGVAAGAATVATAQVGGAVGVIREVAKFAVNVGSAVSRGAGGIKGGGPLASKMPFLTLFLYELGKHIERESNSMVPVDTGFLKSSSFVEVRR